MRRSCVSVPALQLIQHACLPGALQAYHHTLALLQCLLGQCDSLGDLGSNAHVLEEALMGGPELAPHGLPALFVVLGNQVSCFLEQSSALHPLQHSENLNCNNLHSQGFGSIFFIGGEAISSVTI